MALKKYITLILFLLLLFSCKWKSYIPKDDNALLASLHFSEGLKLEEEFNSSTFNYTLKVPSSANLKGFFVICIPDNPSSTCSLSIAGITIPLFYVPIRAGLPNFSFEILVTSPNKTEQKYTVSVAIN
ncbi:MAG: hypothetical protein ACTTKH_02720 [Treponema sp.]